MRISIDIAKIMSIIRANLLKDVQRMAINRALRRERLRACLTQAESARALGVDQTAVSQWETGETSPRLEKIPEIARVYKCPISRLFADDDDITENEEKAV